VNHYLGIDIGTSGCRGCLLDSAGAVRAQAAVGLPAAVARNGRSEQDPRLWWQALCRLLDTLAGGDPGLAAVSALAVDGTSASLLLAAADGSPLGPALMYNDARAADQARAVARVAPTDCAAHGASASLAKLLYLQGAPAGAAARFALHQADWLAGRLAGRYGITDENNALKLGYDPVGRRWPAWLERLGVRRELLPEVVPPGQVIGTIDPALAGRWGLPRGTRVVSGTTDSTAGFLATGAEAGAAVTALGSTLVLKINAAHPLFVPEYGIYSHRLGTRWLVGGASNSGGAVLRQFFSAADIERLSARLRPQSPTGLDYYPLPARGERFPVNDPGLEPRLEPRPADDAVFLQAILEGIAAIEQRGYRLLESLGAPWPGRVYTVGGGAHNSAWRRLREDRLGIPVISAADRQAACGAALLARQGMELHSTTENTEGTESKFK
jgi:sugar (pentulose or hexulose) kinase